MSLSLGIGLGLGQQAAGGGFDPATVFGLLGDYDIGVSANVTTVSGLVSDIADNASISADLSQVTASERMVHLPNEVVTNGFDAAQMDVAGHGIALPASIPALWFALVWRVGDGTWVAFPSSQFGTLGYDGLRFDNGLSTTLHNVSRNDATAGLGPHFPPFDFHVMSGVTNSNTFTQIGNAATNRSTEGIYARVLLWDNVPSATDQQYIRDGLYDIYGITP